MFDLFDPLGPHAFVRDFLFKKAVHIRGRSDRFAGLLDRAKLEAALARIKKEKLPVVFMADFRHAKERNSRESAESVIGPFVECTVEQAPRLFNAGATICMTGVERAIPALARLATRVKAQLGYTGMVDARIYDSPDGQGFDTHWDSRVAMTLQIEGRKTWRFAETASVPYPKANAWAMRKGGKCSVEYVGGRRPHPADASSPPDERSFREVVLAPGDVLALPPGTWHQASAVGHSLAINLALNYPRERLPFFDFLERALEPQLTGVPAWRALPPASVFETGTDAMPEEVAYWFEDRLRELRAAIERLDPSGRELAHAWRLSICDPNANRTGDATPAMTKRLRKDEVLLTPEPGLLHYGDGINGKGEPKLMLYCALPAVSVPFSDAARPFLRRLTQVRRFRAGECVAWGGPDQSFSWSDVRALLEVLHENGVLRREASP